MCHYYPTRFKELIEKLPEKEILVIKRNKLQQKEYATRCEGIPNI